MPNGTGKLILAQTKAIERKLAEENITTQERVVLETLNLILILFGDDHQKTKKMWNTYVPMAFVISVAAATIIGLLFTGHIVLLP